MYADGAGLRYIAQQLTDDGVPSPSQYDPVRNRHRDPRGWSHSALRAILDNPTYRGVRFWGRQQKYEVLVNPDDVAAGHETRTRWRDPAEWITPARRTHEALVTDNLADAVHLRMQARRGPDLVCSRESSTPYALRGMLYCGVCGAHATAAERAQVYAGLNLRLDYDPHRRQVQATADLSRVAGRVRGGVCPRGDLNPHAH